MSGKSRSGPTKRFSIFITGATGYLGGRLAAALAEDAHIYLGTSQPVDSLHPALLKVGTPFRTPRGESPPGELLKDVAAVIHLAAPNEIECSKDPEKLIQQTVIHTDRLAREAQLASVKHFLYFSTIHVYGSPLAGDITEESQTRPDHPYAEAHLSAESRALSIGGSNLNSTVLRLSNAIGAPLHPAINRWTLLFNDLCRQAVTTGELVMRSPGLDYRDFITIRDVILAVKIILRLPLGQGAQVLNLGSGHTRLVIEVAKLIADRAQKLLGKPIHIKLPNCPAPGPPSPFTFKPSRLRSLGFQPTADLRAAIDESLSFCQDHFG